MRMSCTSRPSLKESLFRLKFRKSLGVGDTIKDIRRERRRLAGFTRLLKNKDAEGASKRVRNQNA